jgi:hypothetical protein
MLDLIRSEQHGIPLYMIHREVAEECNRLHLDNLFYPTIWDLWDTLYISKYVII